MTTGDSWTPCGMSRLPLSCSGSATIVACESRCAWTGAKSSSGRHVLHAVSECGFIEARLAEEGLEPQPEHVEAT